MVETNELLRIRDYQALSMLRELAKMDQRSMGKEAAWLIRREWAARGFPPTVSDVFSDDISVSPSVEVIE